MRAPLNSWSLGSRIFVIQGLWDLYSIVGYLGPAGFGNEGLRDL